LCDNDFPFGYEANSQHEPVDKMQCTLAESQPARAQDWERSMTQQPHRLLAWALLPALLAYLSYLSFKAYLSPEFLIGFANQFSC
jgi:hypothetical protein